MRTFLVQAGVLIAVFAAASALAEALGAANVGTALGFGQIAFALALIWMIVKR